MSTHLSDLFTRGEKPQFDWDFNEPLLEASIKEIKLFAINSLEHGDPGHNRGILEMLYEIEYKYSMLRDRPFEGHPRRKERILSILEEKGKEVVSVVADSFQEVFEEWLKHHAITRPRTWAFDRYNEIIDEGVDFAIEVALAEYKRYGDEYETEEEMIVKAISERPEMIDDKLFDGYVQDERVMMLDFLDDGLDEFNDRIERFTDQTFETDEEAREWISKHFAEFNEDFISLYGSKEEAKYEIVSELADAGYFEDPNILLVDSDELVITIYEILLFPVWYAYWSKQGIDETRQNIVDMVDSLSKIDSLPLRKQFAVLNKAKNMNHQNGSMMEYYFEMWAIDERDFEDLSGMEPDDSRMVQWNNELAEIGVVL